MGGDQKPSSWSDAQEVAYQRLTASPQPGQRPSRDQAPPTSQPGPPPSAPPSWRASPSWRLGIVVAILVGIWSLAQQPWSNGTLDHVTLESDIERWAERRGGKAIDEVRVECPPDIEIEAGRRFNCIMRSGRLSLGVEVTVENDDGYLTWQVAP